MLQMFRRFSDTSSAGRSSLNLSAFTLHICLVSLISKRMPKIPVRGHAAPWHLKLCIPVHTPKY